MTDTQRYKFSLCRTIGTMGVIALITLCLVMGGSTGFINAPAAVVTFGLCFFLLLGTFGTDYLRFIPASLACLVATPQEGNPRYAEIATFGCRYVIGGGTVGALIGMMQMLQNMTDPSSIGAGLAASLITPFYALIASEFFFAFVYKAFSDSGTTDSTPLSARHVLVPIIVIGSMMGLFCVILVAFRPMQQ